MQSKDIKGLQVNFTKAANGQFTGTATGYVQTTLTGVFGIKTVGVNAKASATATASGGSVCILVLDTGLIGQALLVNSGAQIDARDCEIHVRSTAVPAAIFNSGSKLDTKKICIKGALIIDNGGTHPNVATSCAAEADPFAGAFPEPSSSSCTYSNGNYSGGTVTLNPGVYCGWFNFNNGPTVNFNPGVYVIKGGGWNVNAGTWTGSGVTFFFADQSKIQFNSAVAATLSAPTSGTYKNVVMFEKDGLARSQFVFNDARGMNLDGIVYLPSRDVTFNAGSGLMSKEMTLVVNTLILDQTNWKFYTSEHNIGAGSGVKEVRLVE
jgi:hypothetical protein